MRRRLAFTREVAVPPARLWEVVADPARLAAVAPSILGMRILEREMDIEIVELTLAGRADPLVLEVVRLGPTRLRFDQVDRFAGRGVSGSVEVSAATSGCTLRFDVRLSAPFFGGLGKVRDAIVAALEAATVVPASDAAPAELVIRFEAGTSDLTVTIDGRRFRLVPVESP